MHVNSLDEEWVFLHCCSQRLVNILIYRGCCRGVATIDIELTNIDVNQCDPDLASPGGALDVFRGTHNCQPTTVVRTETQLILNQQRADD